MLTFPKAYILCIGSINESGCLNPTIETFKKTGQLILTLS